MSNAGGGGGNKDKTVIGGIGIPTPMPGGVTPMPAGGKRQTAPNLSLIHI